MDSLQVPNNHRSFHQFDTFRTIATLCHMMSYSASPCHALVCGMVEADLPWLWAKLQLGGDVIWNKNQMKRIRHCVWMWTVAVWKILQWQFYTIFIQSSLWEEITPPLEGPPSQAHSAVYCCALWSGFIEMQMDSMDSKLQVWHRNHAQPHLWCVEWHTSQLQQIQ